MPGVKKKYISSLYTMGLRKGLVYGFERNNKKKRRKILMEEAISSPALDRRL
jgi:hypothetical protein